MSFVFINCTAETFTPTKSGAICTYIWELCNTAKKQGIEPWIVSRTSSAEPYSWPKTIFVKYPHIPKNKYISKLYYMHRDLTGWGHVRQKAYNVRLVKAIKKAGLQKYPLFLNNDIELAVYLREQFPKARIFHHAHNDNPCSEKFRKQFGDAINGASAVSSACAHWNRGYFGLKEVKTLYSGVDLERFHPADSVPGGPPLINFVGRTDYNKGTDLLLLAAKKLSKKTKNFRLQILGSNHYGYSVKDDFQDTIVKISEELEAAGISVYRPGFVDRHALPEQLRKAHINVVPSRWDEPFGLVTPEGMASGLATVASRTGGTPEIVGENGLLFERGNVDELADHLEMLITNPEILSKYQLLARQRAEMFSWDKTLCNLRAMLEV
jgi:glycosyltransferase involved in cell wall biosynthesis